MGSCNVVMKILILCLVASFLSIPVWSEMVFVRAPYELDGTVFEGTLVYDEGALEVAEEKGETLVSILMVPNWMGPGARANEKAAKIAGEDYVVFVADVYGTDVRPTNAQEAAAAAGALRAGDRQRLRDRVKHAHQILRGYGEEEAALDPEKMIAIGFCFGGGAVLELARTGAAIPAVVSFHGNLDSPQPAQEGDISAKILVLHGGEDPYVPGEQVKGFHMEMRESKTEDWQLVVFGGTVHSFTDPYADSDGARYHERSATRAFEYMEELIEELFEDDDD